MKIWVFIFGLSIFLYNTSVAQSDFENDAAIWISLGLDKKINKKLVLHLTQQNRLNNNFSTYGRGNINFGASYKLTKNFRFLGEYSYLKRPFPDNTYSNEHRLSAALFAKKSIGPFEFAYRNLLQLRLYNIYTTENGKIPVYYWRNRLTIKYKINKYLTPYISQEIYYPFDQSPTKGLSRSRSIAGIETRLSKNTQLDFYFLFQQKLNAFNTTNRDYVYGVSLSRQL